MMQNDAREKTKQVQENSTRIRRRSGFPKPIPDPWSLYTKVLDPSRSAGWSITPIYTVRLYAHGCENVQWVSD